MAKATTQKPGVRKVSGAAAQGVVIQNITIRPVVRTSVDIQNWRNAIRNWDAIVPMRVPMFDLLDDIMLDGFLSSIVDKRIKAVTRTKLIFQDENGKEIPEMSKLIKKKQFRNLRTEIQKQKYWNLAGVELSRENDEFKVYVIPRKHIKPELGKITFEQMGIDGVDYTLPPASNYVVVLGDGKEFGLLFKAAQYVIYKRGGFGDWAHFAEVFGMPFREARYDGYNDGVRQQLELALQEAGSASYAILPKEAEITFHEAKSTQGSSELYNQLRKACNEELSVLILGQTETTTSSSGSGYAQSKTHADVEAGINEDDREDELSILNENILPILANLGYPVGNGSFVHLLDKQQLNTKDKADVWLKFKQDGKLPINDDDIYEEFGIPKPKDYDKMKKQQEEAAPVPPAPGSPVPPKPGKKNKKQEDAQLVALIGDAVQKQLNDFFGSASNA